MASGDGDGNVTLWDVADPARPHRLVSSSSPQAREGSVSALQFSPDGNVLAAGHLYNTTVTWDLTQLNALRRDPRQAACDRTGRGLDPSEWERYVSGLEYQDTCSG
jgi:WD40 repeat protein